jgi:very-short-patch-repair endonuclease
VIDIDQRAWQQASEQHGVLGRQQALAIGFSRSAIRHRIASGRWESISPRAIRLAGSPSSELQLAMAATIDVPGSVISHESAAALCRLPGFRLLPLHLLRLRDDQHPPSTIAYLHVTTHLPDGHRAAHLGIPITTPDRTLFDLAPRVHPLRLERLIDSAWSKGLVSGSRLLATLADHAERGRDGIQVMRDLLEDRGANYRPPDSNLEARVQELARSAGIHTLARQVEVGGVERIGRVDFSDTDVPLVVEVDSETYHGSRLDERADELRDVRLRAAGFVIVRITEFDAWHNPDKVRTQLREARSSAAHRHRQLGA